MSTFEIETDQRGSEIMKTLLALKRNGVIGPIQGDIPTSCRGEITE